MGLKFQVPAISIHFCKKYYFHQFHATSQAPKSQESRAKSAPLSALEAWAREDLCLDLGIASHHGMHVAARCILEFLWPLFYISILIHWWVLYMFLLVYCRPLIFSNSFSQQIGTSDHTGLIIPKPFGLYPWHKRLAPEHHTFPSFLGLWNWRFLVTSLLVAENSSLSQ